MKVNLKIRRQKAGGPARWEDFTVDCQSDCTVTRLLDSINDKDVIMTTEGKQTTPIVWECSCNQKLCGACAMVINRRPMLACSAFVRDLGENITLTPLSKFPLVEDLQCDRSILYENQKRLRMFLQGDALKNKKDNEMSYQASRCMMCGCCLEVCENYHSGDYFGAEAMVNSYKMIALESDRAARRAKTKEIIKHGINGCSKSLACRDVCPAEIPIGETISALGRKVLKYYFGG